LIHFYCTQNQPSEISPTDEISLTKEKTSEKPSEVLSNESRYSGNERPVISKPVDPKITNYHSMAFKYDEIVDIKQKWLGKEMESFKNRFEMPIAKLYDDVKRHMNVEANNEVRKILSARLGNTKAEVRREFRKRKKTKKYTQSLDGRYDRLEQRFQDFMAKRVEDHNISDPAKQHSYMAWHFLMGKTTEDRRQREQFSRFFILF